MDILQEMWKPFEKVVVTPLFKFPVRNGDTIPWNQSAFENVKKFRRWKRRDAIRYASEGFFACYFGFIAPLMALEAFFQIEFVAFEY